MKIETISIDKIKPYEKNAKLHPKEQIEQIKKSIEMYGNNDPIAVWGKNNTIVEGHGRYLALKEMGATECEIIRLDHLTNKQRREYMLVHNKLTMNTDFDFDILYEELGDLDFDGFDFGFEMETEFLPEEVVEDDVPEVPTEPKAKLGDLYQLGDHRLICGDSTDVNVIERLMGGCKADISFTSPPYNAGHMDVSKSAERGGGLDKSTTKKYVGDDDQKTDDEYFDFISSIMDILLINSDEVFFNIGVGAGSKRTIGRLIYQYADYFKDLIYWEKDNPVPCIVESVISSAVELIICFGANGSRSFNHFKDRMFHGVINGHSASGSNKYADIHKATFPIYLPSEVIQRFTDINGTVFDCFGGTGTTMIACEQLHRKCYMSELEPMYVDVIIERWENLTGQKAVLLNE